jgi:hypothetical protein
LEAGSRATQFVKPDPATETYKCQRYLAPLSAVSEIVVKDSETILTRLFHLRPLAEYGVYNPGNYSFYLKSLDGMTVSEGVLPTHFINFPYETMQGNVRVAPRPLFAAGNTGVRNMNTTPNINDNIVTTSNLPILLTAEI